MTLSLRFSVSVSTAAPDDLEQMALWLEKKANQVRAGDVSGVVFATIMGDGRIRSGWGMLPGGNSYVLLAAAAYLQHDLLHETKDNFDA